MPKKLKPIPDLPTEAELRHFFETENMSRYAWKNLGKVSFPNLQRTVLPLKAAEVPRQ